MKRLLCLFGTAPQHALARRKHVFARLAKPARRLLGACALGHFIALAGAADITVTSLADAGAGSLRQAIADVTPGGVIDFDPAVFTAVSHTISLSSEVVISKQITVDGGGGITLDGNQSTRLIHVATGGNLTLRGLTLTHGNGTGSSASGFGGAIFSTASMRLENCSFTANQAINYGGAIASTGSLELVGCTVSGNSAGSLGGGIYSATPGNLVLTNSTITANNATLYGGAIYHTSPVTLIHGTLVGNHASNRGGGIYNDFESTLTLRSSIVAGNSAPTDENFFGDFDATGSSITEGDPKLAPLGAYGGSTLTMPPLPDSPTIDNGSDENLATDQRGFPRILATSPDVGAVETEAGSYTVTGLTLHTRVPSADSDGVFEMSTDPDFLPVVSTFAGTGVAGMTDGTRATAQFANPSAVATDALGNTFLADAGNHRIRMIDPAGNVSTIAGKGPFSGLANGPGPDAEFAFPSSVAVGPDGNVYVTDTFNHRICKLVRPTVAGGIWMVETLAGPTTPGNAGFLNQTGSAARFNHPYGLTVDSAGNVYVADAANHRIRKITASGGVSTFAGSGIQGLQDSATPSSARFDFPEALVLVGNALYVVDTGNHSIRKIAIAGNLAADVTTFAGSGIAGFTDGTGAGADFNSPSGITADAAGILYVTDGQNHSIRSVITSDLSLDYRKVTTVAGTGSAGLTNGKANVAQFRAPTGVTVDSAGNLIVADHENHLLRRIIIQNTEIVSVADSGDLNAAGLQQVSAILDADALGLDPGAIYYFRWVSSNGTVQSLGQRFTLHELPLVTTLPADNLTPTTALLHATVDPKANPTEVRFEYSTDPDMLAPYRVSTLAGSTAAGLAGTSGIAGDGNGGSFVTDRAHHRILHITATGAISTVAGSGAAGFGQGLGTAASFEDPAGLAIDGDGNLYVADEGNHCIRKITPAGLVSTFAGSGVAGFGDGPKASALFLYPAGVAVDAAGDVFVADTGNHRIRKISASTGEVSTIAGTGVVGFSADGPAEFALFSSPRGIAVDAAGTRVWVADTGNHSLRLLFANSAFTLAGNGSAGFADGLGSDGRFSSPTGVAVDESGDAFVSDLGNHRIRRVELTGETVTLAGSGIAGTVNSPLLGNGLIPATATQLNAPSAIAIDSFGRLFVAQTDRVREVSRDAAVPTLTLAPRATGSGEQPVQASIPQPLLPGSTYYFRAVATNYRGTATGETLDFLTPQAAITVSTDGLAIAHQQASPVNFGETPTGQPVILPIVVSNPGSYALHLSGVTLPVGYQLSGGPWTIAPLDSITLNVTLSATSAGNFPGNVAILSDAPGQSTFSFPISGVVLDPPTVTTLAATDVTGQSATLNAQVNPLGSPTTVWFEWSLDPEFDAVTVGTRASTLDHPAGLATDSAGNLYIADTAHHRIVKVAVDGTESIFAGTGVAGFTDGPGASAQFNEPIGIAVSSTGIVFVADSKNHRIRAITLAGNVSTFAGLGTAGFTDGVPAAARFNLPSGLALASNGTLLVADRANHRIRKIALDGNVSTLAGLTTAGSDNGAANVARFDNPLGIAVAAAGFTYVTEASSHAIRQIAADGSTSIFAGSATNAGMANATGSSARFSNPTGLAMLADGRLLVADTGNHQIRAISPAGEVATFAGDGISGSDDGLGEVARFDQPISLSTTPTGDVFVGEMTQSTLREITSTQVLVQVSSGLTGTTALAIQSPLAGLAPGNVHYFRAIATNGGGTTVGSIFSFGDPFVVWQSEKFGANAGDPLIAGPTATPANDGVSNLLKYAFHLDPLVPATAADLPLMDMATGEIGLTYTRVIAATNLDYTPEWSANLATWSPLGITQQILTDDGITQQIRASIPATPGAARFLRINVTLQQP
ncbi:MAG: choice-of-anchor Q domain-containing protein [Verrucomicrobiota bacterium]